MKLVRWIIAGAMCATGWANSVDLSPPAGIIGYADNRGRALYNVEFEGVDAGDGVKLPFRFIFQSGINAASNYQWSGWQVPIIEANLKEIARGYFQVTLPCGKKLNFSFPTEMTSNAGTYCFQEASVGSQDGSWMALLGNGFPVGLGSSQLYNFGSGASNTSFTITRWDGWSLNYLGGLLHQLTTDTGKVINWEYNGPGNRLSRIYVQSTNQTILQVTYAGTSSASFPTAITVNGDTYSLNISGDQQLLGIGHPDGTSDTFSYTNYSAANLATYGAFSNYQGSNVTMQHTNRYGFVRTLTWDSLNQFLLSDGQWNYSVSAPVGQWLVVGSGGYQGVGSGRTTAPGYVADSTYGAPTIKRTRIATGEWEQIAFAGDRDSTHTLTAIDGIQTRITEDKSIGPVCGKTTKIERLINGTWTQIYYAAYDQTTGRLLRATDGNGKDTVYTYTDQADSDLPHPMPGWNSTVYAPPLTKTVTDPTNRSVTYTYNTRGKVVKFTSASGVMHSFQYDNRDRVTTIQNNAGTVIWKYTYNNNNRVTSITDAASNSFNFSYLDRYGNSMLTGITTPSGLAASETYDAHGNPTTLVRFNGETWTLTPNQENRLQKITDPLNNQTQFGYDNQGNLASVTDALGKETDVQSDDLNLPKQITDALSHISTFQNDGNEQTTSITDNRNKNYSLEYTPERFRKKLTFPGGSNNSSLYDLDNHLMSWTNRAGTVVTFSRDDAGRVTGMSWTSGGGYRNTYTYDSGGRASEADSTSPTVTLHKSHTYDSEGRISTVTLEGRTLTYHYDNNNRIIKMDYPAGFSISYDYDSDGRLVTIRSTPFNHTLVTYTYNSKGQIASRADYDGYSSSYTYDKLNRVTAMTIQKNGTTVWIGTYGYDAVGNRIYSTGQYGGTAGDAYQYDALNQLTDVKYKATNVSAGYSAATSPTSTESLAYDAAGNRTSDTKTSGTVSYTVNDLNQYTAITGLSPTYDAMGNLTSHTDSRNGQVWSLSYDALGRLIGAYKTAGNVNMEYGYDAYGNRAFESEVVGGTDTYYTRHLLYSGNQMIECYEDIPDNGVGGTPTTYIYGPGTDNVICSCISSANNPRFYFQDPLGSVIMLTDTYSNSILQYYSYDAWGNVTVYDKNWTVQNYPDSRFLFTGRDFDEETGLYHYRARAYDPTIGRFLQPDPIDFYGEDLDMYRYVWNAPTNYRDPSGLLLTDGSNDPGNREAWDAAMGITPEERAKSNAQDQKMLDGFSDSTKSMMVAPIGAPENFSKLLWMLLKHIVTKIWQKTDPGEHSPDDNKTGGGGHSTTYYCQPPHDEDGDGVPDDQDKWPFSSLWS